MEDLRRQRAEIDEKIARHQYRNSFAKARQTWPFIPESIPVFCVRDIVAAHTVSQSHDVRKGRADEYERLARILNAIRNAGPSNINAELVAALEKIASCNSWVEGDVVSVAREALAKVKGATS